MPLFWLRIAVGLYGIGLGWALFDLVRRRAALPESLAALLKPGWWLQGVALVEAFHQFGRASLSMPHVSESLFAWLLLGLFLLIHWRYRTMSPGLFVLPAVFLLSLSAALGQMPPHFASPIARNWWLVAHVSLIFLGYAALFLSFVFSLLYLVQERSLKAKRLSSALGWLPSLQTIDDIGYQTLLFGFPFITLGLVMGSVLAEEHYGASYFHDPKILLSLFMWALYMGLLYGRWNAGWRGRKAAYFATFAFVATVCAWAANAISGVHGAIMP